MPPLDVPAGEIPRRVFSGARWESEVGYCRAIRRGERIWVSGTAPVGDDGSTFAPGDAVAQAERCIDRIAGALRRLGADLPDVVRTRMYVTDIGRWREIARAHRQAFADHPPATTMIGVATLIDPQMIVEIEAEAVVRSAVDSGNA